MIFLSPGDSINVAYMCLEKAKYLSIFRSPLSYLEDILDISDIADDDQEAWNHLLMTSFYPEDSKNVAYVHVYFKAKYP